MKAEKPVVCVVAVLFSTGFVLSLMNSVLLNLLCVWILFYCRDQAALIPIEGTEACFLLSTGQNKLLSVLTEMSPMAKMRAEAYWGSPPANLYPLATW